MGANACKCLDQKSPDNVTPNIRHSKRLSKMRTEKGTYFHNSININTFF